MDTNHNKLHLEGNTIIVVWLVKGNPVPKYKIELRDKNKDYKLWLGCCLSGGGGGVDDVSGDGDNGIPLSP